MRRSFSLRRRVGVWLLPPLVILVAINAYLSYRGSAEAVNRAYDRSLLASLKAIAERTHSLEGAITVDIPYSAFEVFEDQAQERIFHAVYDPTGGMVTGYDDLRPPVALRGSDDVRIVDSVYRGEDVRMGVLRKRLYDPVLEGGDAVTIVFAETIGARNRLTASLFVDSLRRQLALVVLGVTLVLLTLSSAFRPLLKLRDRVRARDVEDLTPIPRDDVPSEVGPLIDAINVQMERLSAMLVARRAFLADAAHQIRTPLTVMMTQAEVGLRQTDAVEMHKTFASVVGTLRSARRLTNQMLAMSQAEAVNGLISEREPLDLTQLVREITMDLAPLALDRHIDLAFEDSGAQVIINGNLRMLRDMVSNLVDNAIRYSPPGGAVVVAVAGWDEDAAISVTDQGPGIPVSEREKVFARFYRILGQSAVEGSGLGLAIVREICWAHGGRIELKDGEDGCGLCVEVELPLGGKKNADLRPGLRDSDPHAGKLLED